MNDEAFGPQIYRLEVEDVKGKFCLTRFSGMRFTKDKDASIVRKWHSKITTDAYAVKCIIKNMTDCWNRQPKMDMLFIYSQLGSLEEDNCK